LHKVYIYMYTICMECLSYGIFIVSYDSCALQHIKSDTPCNFFGGEGGAVSISGLVYTVELKLSDLNRTSR
jgi:hypothetical protein